ncbi:MAG: methyltransferase domain-containing protein [Novosphingobium sp.]
MTDSADERAAAAVDLAIAEIGSFDLKIEGASQGMPSLATANGTASYVARHRHEYVRTVRDVLEFAEPDSEQAPRVLEIGAFFGTTCIALSQLGYSVTAADAPEFIVQPEQVARFARHGIASRGVRLEDYLLPFGDEEFDIVIMCEVIEHLNFNPLPLFKEINRILRPGGLFYIAMPNPGSLVHRKLMMRGKLIGFDIQEYFTQLDPSSSEIVYGHWREYTPEEVRRMLEPLGFTIERQYFFSIEQTLPVSSLRRRASRLFYRSFPQFRENQVALAVRTNRTDLKMRIPATVHKDLREL